MLTPLSHPEETDTVQDPCSSMTFHEGSMLPELGFIIKGLEDLEDIALSTAKNTGQLMRDQEVIFLIASSSSIVLKNVSARTLRTQLILCCLLEIKKPYCTMG